MICCKQKKKNTSLKECLFKNKTETLVKMKTASLKKKKSQVILKDNFMAGKKAVIESLSCYENDNSFSHFKKVTIFFYGLKIDANSYLLLMTTLLMIFTI